MDDAFERYDAERYQKIRKRPVCHECEEHVGDEYYEVAGLIFCVECMESHLHQTEED